MKTDLVQLTAKLQELGAEGTTSLTSNWETAYHLERLILSLDGKWKCYLEAVGDYQYTIVIYKDGFPIEV